MTQRHRARAKTKRPAFTAAPLKPARRPVFVVTGRDKIAIRRGATIGHRVIAKAMPLSQPAGGYRPGHDYGVFVAGKSFEVRELSAAMPPGLRGLIGGFHFAPGGNATARTGGDNVPAINPRSVWDTNFRPACTDPRGMTLVDGPRGKFWCDIYLLAKDHLTRGTSRFAATIADGNDPPQNPDGGYFAKLDYATAVAVMKHHGKGLLSIEEFFAAAFGVTERTSHSGDPVATQLDAARTSKFGLMQATGNLWVWGHDGDPDQPRPSIFGGSWWIDDVAGSRQAGVDYWAVNSSENLGARGRSDHLPPESSPRQRRRAR
ncbi:MAG: hypothetical protein B7Y77_02625 [Bradyrhizobium sp. 35-63-5]|nr:MAG: hypothetical protein B7Y77_02625 [Bradyrhizobium sp. 35-63-5]